MRTALSFSLLANPLVTRLQFEPEFNKAVVCKSLVSYDSFTLAVGSKHLFNTLDALAEVA